MIFSRLAGEGGGGGDGYRIYMELEYFKKFLNKPMQKESDFGGIFFENSISPLRVNSCVPKTGLTSRKLMDVVGESGLK